MPEPLKNIPTLAPQPPPPPPPPPLFSLFSKMLNPLSPLPLPLPTTPNMDLSLLDFKVCKQIITLLSIRFLSHLKTTSVPPHHHHHHHPRRKTRRPSSGSPPPPPPPLLQRRSMVGIGKEESSTLPDLAPATFVMNRADVKRLLRRFLEAHKESAREKDDLSADQVFFSRGGRSHSDEIPGSGFDASSAPSADTTGISDMQLISSSSSSVDDDTSTRGRSTTRRKLTAISAAFNPGCGTRNTFDKTGPSMSYTSTTSVESLSTPANDLPTPPRSDYNPLPAVESSSSNMSINTTTTSISSPDTTMSPPDTTSTTTRKPSSSTTRSFDPSTFEPRSARRPSQHALGHFSPLRQSWTSDDLLQDDDETFVEEESSSSENETGIDIEFVSKEGFVAHFDLDLGIGIGLDVDLGSDADDERESEEGDDGRSWVIYEDGDDDDEDELDDVKDLIEFFQARTRERSRRNSSISIGSRCDFGMGVGAGANAMVEVTT